MRYIYTKCDKPTSKRIDACLETLENAPFSASDIKPLKGQLEGLYRIKVGTLRIIFEVIENESVNKVNQLTLDNMTTIELLVNQIKKVMVD